MRLFIESVMVFLGTLIAAALVALASPAGLERATQHTRSDREGTAQILASSHSHIAQKATPPRAPH